MAVRPGWIFQTKTFRRSLIEEDPGRARHQALERRETGWRFFPVYLRERRQERPSPFSSEMKTLIPVRTKNGRRSSDPVKLISPIRPSTESEIFEVEGGLPQERLWKGWLQGLWPRRFWRKKR